MSSENINTIRLTKDLVVLLPPKYHIPPRKYFFGATRDDARHDNVDRDPPSLPFFCHGHRSRRNTTPRFYRHDRMPAAREARISARVREAAAGRNVGEEKEKARRTRRDEGAASATRAQRGARRTETVGSCARSAGAL